MVVDIFSKCGAAIDRVDVAHALNGGFAINVEVKKLLPPAWLQSLVIALIHEDGESNLLGIPEWNGFGSNLLTAILHFNAKDDADAFFDGSTEFFFPVSRVLFLCDGEVVAEREPKNSLAKFKARPCDGPLAPSAVG